jgi:hypothetical protein
MFRMRSVIAGLIVLVPALSASAASVGLDGGNSDPILITDPSWQLLSEDNCVFSITLLPADYRCALYDGSAFSNISSIDFRLRNGGFNRIAFPGRIDVDPNSALPDFAESTLFPDGFTFSLSSDSPFDCLVCVFFSSHPDGIGDPLWVSIVAVNGVANPGTSSVPEPATILLLTPAAFFARRRRARGRNVNEERESTWIPRLGRRGGRSVGR